MKLIAFILVSIPLFLVACMKGPESADCVLHPSTHIAPSDGYVEYFVVNSDQSFVKSFTYMDSTGTVTLELPKLPLRITRYVTKGTPLQMSATGTTIAGHIIAGYSFAYSNISIQASDTCRR